VTDDARQTLVVGYCAGAAGRHALMVGAGLAADLHALLHVLHVIDLCDYPIDPDLPDWEEQARTQLAARRAEVHQLLADHPGEWRYEQTRGEPAHTLAQAAITSGARMIVIGTHANSTMGGAIHHLLAGHSISRTLQRAGIPLLLVPVSTGERHRADR
jgi:nucleotide-binding universal stress UspA family protein